MKHASATRLIPSLAALGVGLTGCSEDIAGEWTVDVFDGMGLPMESSMEMTYADYGYSQSYSASGWMSIDGTGTASLEVQMSYAYSESEGGATESYSEDETYAYSGMVTQVDKARFQIRLTGDENEDDEKLDLDCTIRGDDLLDCDERADGGMYRFSRKEG